MLKTITLHTQNQQLIEISNRVQSLVGDAPYDDGLLNLFIRHTSASLIIQENADPSVQQDLMNWLNRLVPENDALYTHTNEGPDDMPAHIKCMLTQTSLAIPFERGRLMLGTWQGVFLFEHRRGSHQRHIIAHLQN